MSNGVGAAGAAGAAAAAAAAVVNAIKASGAIVRVEPTDFLTLAQRAEKPLVVTAEAFWGGRKYLMSYKGLAFYTRSSDALELPGDLELVSASKIWVPS